MFLTYSLSKTEMEYLTWENSIFNEICQFKNLEINKLNISNSETILEKIMQNDRYEDLFLETENTNQIFDAFKMKKCVQNENIVFKPSYLNDIISFEGLNIRLWVSDI